MSPCVDGHEPGFDIPAREKAGIDVESPRAQVMAPAGKAEADCRDCLGGTPDFRSRQLLTTGPNDSSPDEREVKLGLGGGCGSELGLLCYMGSHL